MDIGMSRLVCYLIYAVSRFNGSRTKEMAKGMWSDSIRIGVENPVDPPAGQRSSLPADEEIGTVCGRPHAQISLDCLDNFIAYIDNPGLIPFSVLDNQFPR